MHTAFTNKLTHSVYKSDFISANVLMALDYSCEDSYRFGWLINVGVNVVDLYSYLRGVFSQPRGSHECRPWRR